MLKSNTWNTAFKPQPAKRLQAKTSTELTLRFNRMADEGYSLFILTLMFGWIPRLNGGLERTGVERRIEILWSGLMHRLFNRPERTGSFGAVFFDLGRERGANLGLHAHAVIALDENRFRGRYGEGFLKFWEQEERQWINRPSTRDRPTRDPIVRSHLTVFDGSQAGIDYCSKSLGRGGFGGLGETPVLYLGGV